MKMVSAAKLRRAQDAILRLRPYANKLNELLANLSQGITAEDSPYVEERKVNNLLIVAMTSNRGLCGSFNSQVIKTTLRLLEENRDKNVKVLAIGKKAEDYFKKFEGVLLSFPQENLKELTKVNDIYDRLTYQNSEIFSEFLMKKFEDKTFDKVILVYNQFKNAATQVVQIEDYLPIKPSVKDNSKVTDYIFEPSKTEIVVDLIPQSLKMILYKALRDSFAAEHGARMTAMHKATDNATELLRTLRLNYNKARQAAITGEILEIVAGAEALH
jgi:F-type H+-transporting ATPase subunit gamma